MTEVKWVTVVDDDAAVRETVKAWLTCRGGWYRVRSEHALAEDAVAALPVERPDIIVLDVRMGTMDGLECLHHLRPLLPATRIILHTAFGDADVLHHALTGGANGLVQKDGTPEPLLEAIAHATPTGFHLPCCRALPLKAASVAALTARLRISARERQFLQLLTADFGNKGIANELNLGRQYVDNRLPRLYRKLGAHTAAGAVAKAIELGLIPFPRGPADG